MTAERAAVSLHLVYFLQQTPKCSGFCSQFSCFWIVHTPFTPLVDDIPIFTFQTLKNARLLETLSTPLSNLLAVIEKVALLRSVNAIEALVFVVYEVVFSDAG